MPLTNFFAIPISTLDVVCIYSHLAVTFGCVTSSNLFVWLSALYSWICHFQSNKGFLCCQEVVFVSLTHCLFVQHLLHQSTSIHVWNLVSRSKVYDGIIFGYMNNYFWSMKLLYFSMCQWVHSQEIKMMIEFFCILTEIEHAIFNSIYLTDFWVNPQIHVQMFPIYYSFLALSNFFYSSSCY